MRAKTNRLSILIFTAAGAAVGFALRRWQLASAFDEAGLVLPGSPSVWLLGVFCALMAAGLALVCSGLRPRGDYESSFSSGTPELVVSAAAAAAILLGCAMELMNKPGSVQTIVGFLGIAAALCVAVTAVQRCRGIVPSIALHVTPCIYLVVKLIVDFKRWSVDPAVLDYCYELFAAIAVMCAVYHLGGFCYGKGKRRTSAFWCLAGALFSAVSLADGGVSHTLLAGGLGIWAAINAWQLLED